MSHFHSESQNQSLRLTVRVKLLDLDQVSAPIEKANWKEAPEDRLGALIARGGKSLNRSLHLETEAEPDPQKAGELCMADRHRVAIGAFEDHVEHCSACASRVELQLDFMECLEAAVYQRLAEPDCEKVRGALLVSAPKLNFAICGELELD